MRPDASSTIVVAGATGRQGGAVARRLLDAGWHVRALTRSPQSKSARRLATAGVEVVRADMNDHASLDGAFVGAYGVFSVQNPAISGVEGEVRQGTNIADGAHAAQLQHVAYGSAGTGASDTGSAPHDCCAPPPWIAVDDAAAVATLAFAEPERYIGRDLKIAADLRSIDECRELYAEVLGRRPRGFPMPVWLFNRVASRDLVTMWRWLGASEPAGNSDVLRALRPESLSVRDWLERRKDARGQPG